MLTRAAPRGNPAHAGIAQIVTTPGRRGAAMAGNGIKLLLAWGFVGIPLGWGVIETCLNALKLFQ
jgi:hypothetical protein